MSPKRPDLSIVIPALREEKRIGKSLSEIARFLTTDQTFKDKEVEVIVVSADSDDNTHGEIQKKSKLFRDFQFVKPGQRAGKGRDVRAGMLKAHGKAVIFMDADLATPLRHLPKFYHAYKNGADVVVATRNLRKHHPSFFRRLLSNLGNVLFKVLCGIWIEDSQCGFKLFSAKANKVCFSKMTILGWGFDVEILTIAKINKFKMQTFRIDDWKSVPGGQFAAGAFKSAITSLADLLVTFKNRVRGVY